MDGINGIGNNNIWNKGNIGNNAQNKGKNDKIPDESTSFQDMLKEEMQNEANTNTGTNTGANPSDTANTTRNNELQDQNIRQDSNGNISNRKNGSEQNTYDGQGNSQISWTNGSSDNILKNREATSEDETATIGNKLEERKTLATRRNVEAYRKYAGKYAEWAEWKKNSEYNIIQSPINSNDDLKKSSQEKKEINSTQSTQSSNNSNSNQQHQSNKDDKNKETNNGESQYSEAGGKQIKIEGEESIYEINKNFVEVWFDFVRSKDESDRINFEYISLIIYNAGLPEPLYFLYYNEENPNEIAPIYKEEKFYNLICNYFLDDNGYLDKKFRLKLTKDFLPNFIDRHHLDKNKRPYNAQCFSKYTYNDYEKPTIQNNNSKNKKDKDKGRGGR